MYSPAKVISEFHAELTDIRRAIHANPEIAYAENKTAALVAERLKAYGVDEIHTGIGGTGIVGVIHGQQADSKAIGLRADMDCLAMHEETGLAYASKNKGFMHACGHDGHTTMLLGAAKYLAKTRNFKGRAICIFQPAEEGMAGAKAMLDAGLFERWPVEAVYALHNMPSIPFGKLAVRPTAMMAAADRFAITVEGKGGHGGMPQYACDPILVAGHLITAVQSIASRNANPTDSVVVSICAMEAGNMGTFNVIPREVKLLGTVRTYRGETAAMVKANLERIVEHTCAAFGAKGTLDYREGYPATVNTQAEAAFAASVGAEIFGADNVMTDCDPNTGAEDFSYMLQAAKGAYVWIGQGGEGCPPLHSTRYNFDDRIIPNGAGFFGRLVERSLPLA